jgi:hypothetical protein
MADRHTTKWIVVNPPYHFDEKGACGLAFQSNAVSGTM